MKNIRTAIIAFMFIFMSTAFIDSMDDISTQAITEKERVLNTVSMLFNQNRTVLDELEQVIPKNKTIEEYPVLLGLKENCLRNNTNLESIQKNLLGQDRHQLSDDKVPRYDILKASSLNVGQIKQDIKHVIEGENQLSDIEQALYPWRKMLPGKINPWAVTAVCTSIPLFFGVASTLTADEKNMKKEIVMGLFKTCFVGLSTGFVSNYIARFWNPTRTKLDAGTSKEIHDRLDASTKTVSLMNGDVANYLTHLQNAQTNLQSLQIAQQGKFAAEQAAKEAITTGNNVSNLQKSQNQLHQKFNNFEKQLNILEAAAAEVNRILQNQGQQLKITTEQLQEYFTSDAKDRECSQKFLEEKFGQLQGAVVYSILQNQDILKYTKAMYSNQQLNQISTSHSNKDLQQYIPKKTMMLNTLKSQGDFKLWAQKNRNYIILPSQQEPNQFNLKRMWSTKSDAPKDIQNDAGNVIRSLIIKGTAKNRIVAKKKDQVTVQELKQQKSKAAIDKALQALK